MNGCLKENNLQALTGSLICKLFTFVQNKRSYINSFLTS